MKTFFYRALVLAFVSFISASCEQDLEAEVRPLSAIDAKKFGTVPGSTIIQFSETTGYLNEVKVVKDSYTTLPVKITATRFQNGKPVAGNAALVYDTTKPDMRNSAYSDMNKGPFQLGNVLTIGQSQGANTTINDKGGVIEMDFSSFGSVVMRGIYVADIDENEKGSTLEFLDPSGEVIYVQELPVTGAYKFKPVIMAGKGVAGVAKVRVTFKTKNGRGGSGAIDVVQFCPGGVCY